MEMLEEYTEREAVSSAFGGADERQKKIEEWDQVNVRDNDGRTALAVARQWGLREMEALLLQVYTSRK